MSTLLFSGLLFRQPVCKQSVLIWQVFVCCRYHAISGGREYAALSSTNIPWQVSSAHSPDGLTSCRETNTTTEDVCVPAAPSHVTAHLGQSATPWQTRDARDVTRWFAVPLGASSTLLVAPGQTVNDNSGGKGSHCYTSLHQADKQCKRHQPAIRNIRYLSAERAHGDVPTAVCQYTAVNYSHRVQYGVDGVLLAGTQDVSYIGNFWRGASNHNHYIYTTNT